KVLPTRGGSLWVGVVVRRFTWRKTPILTLGSRYKILYHRSIYRTTTFGVNNHDDRRSLLRSPEPRAAGHSRCRALQVRTHHYHATRRGHQDDRWSRGDQPVRQQLPRAVVESAGHRGGARGAAHARLRPELGSLHLRHAGPAQDTRIAPGAL